MEGPAVSAGRPDQLGYPVDLLRQVASVAHALWCERMRSDGWGFGRVFDAAARLHDALVPFDRLAEDDRLATMERIRAEGWLGRLQASVQYPRGPDRPFIPAELAIGLVVECAYTAAETAQRPLRGRVISWTIDPVSHMLEAIEVQWENGQVSEHLPAERELRRVPPSPPVCGPGITPEDSDGHLAAPD